jgi:hypothetical protein
MILAGRLIAGIALFVCTAAAMAAPLHRYLVRVDDSLERLAVSACFDGAAPQALVTGSDFPGCRTTPASTTWCS